LISCDLTSWLVALTGGTLLRDPDVDVLESASYAWVCVVAMLGQLIVGGARQLYTGRHSVGSPDDTANVALSFSVAGLAAFVVGVLDATTPWSIPLIAMPIAVVLAVAARLTYRLHRDRGLTTYATDAERRVVIFGADDAGRQILASLMADPDGRYQPVALLDDNPGLVNRRLRGVPVRGTAQDAVTVARAEGADLLVVAGRRLDAPVTQRITEAAARANLEVRVVPPLTELLFDDPEGHRTMRVPAQRKAEFVRVVPQGRGKRVLDIGLCLLALPLILPLGLVITLLVALSSSDEIIYRAPRLGRNGRVFMMYKFSGMRQAAAGPPVTQARDPRITPLGRVLRASKLDELPQVINVLTGEMSIVGPRPEDPRYLSYYTDAQLRMLTVRPGMTSQAFLRFGHEQAYIARAAPADVESYYLTRLLPEKLAIELDYVRNWSVRRDLEIIVRTVKGLLT
jgi:lipopolysaccharide/colanic/teichoic acid biosynthesis glycosyltransferase